MACLRDRWVCGACPAGATLLHAGTDCRTAPPPLPPECARCDAAWSRCTAPFAPCATGGPPAHWPACNSSPPASPARVDTAYFTTGAPARFWSIQSQTRRLGLAAARVISPPVGGERTRCAQLELPLWPERYLSLHLATIDVLRGAVRCAARAAWLLVLEDDAQLPAQLPRMLEAITRRVDADVVWLDARAGDFGRGPAPCCAAGTLYRTAFLPRLLEHFELGAERRSCRGANDFGAGATDLWLAQLVDRLSERERRHVGAVVPIIGTRGFASLAQARNTSNFQLSSARWAWDARRSSWPAWLERAAAEEPPEAAHAEARDVVDDIVA
ncbi:hypothetical protein AB1Y20_017307 [Prymnesium parvum]|uniref:Uncharacterized protein n=1 Tax=Prymnesium parvum TaxID=97485 RepID=A0AB34JJU3_PRYPA